MRYTRWEINVNRPQSSAEAAAKLLVVFGPFGSKMPNPSYPTTFFG